MLEKIEVSTIQSGAPINILQAIVLLEILGLYRSRSSGVYRSPHFDALYSSVSALTVPRWVWR